MQTRVILLHKMAPPKPATGAHCNGCGVCCASEPCPLGVLLSGHTQGRCRALRWHEAHQHYRCGALQGLPERWPGWASALAQRVAARWISAGSGCDCSLQAEKGE